jgi:hypothetical protein
MLRRGARALRRYQFWHHCTVCHLFLDFHRFRPHTDDMETRTAPKHRNRNSMKATAATIEIGNTDNGNETQTFKFRNSVGGFDRCVCEIAAWVGMTGNQISGWGFSFFDTTTDDERAMGMSSGRMVFTQKSTGDVATVATRTAWVTR